ncbi:AmmeMemoRadiSam system protein A [Patescibacteria group bacterium]|nr:AmmeMemoRadiSam system protein A [Patescibacteria group bacterium]
MEEYSKGEKEFLLKLARRSIEYYFDTGDKLTISESEISSENLKRKRAAFVTLTQNRNLRGCIGGLEPVLSLYEEVIDKSFSSAFRDLRFQPLSEKELGTTKIAISILTVPQSLSFNSHPDLLAKINPGKDGIVLKKDGYSATYLPGVWKEIKDKEEFLSSLCHKAGLPLNSWKWNAEILTYRTIEFSE